MLFITICIRHAISEFEGGLRRTSKFEGYKAEGISVILLEYILLITSLGIYRRVRNTWYAQAQPRQDRILQILLRNIHQQAAWEQQTVIKPVNDVVDNPFASGMDDLDELEANHKI